MPEIVRTKEMAERLGISEASLNQAANLYGAPSYKEYFVPLNGRGKKQTGWDSPRVVLWYKKTGRMNDAGNVINLRTGQLRKSRGKGIKRPRGRRLEQSKSQTGHSNLNAWMGGPATPGEVKLGLAHLLGAFAFACENGGIPHDLQELLEAADLEKLDIVALDIIEEMALKHPKTEAQWILIKEALPTLIRRAKGADPGLPIKITIQAGPNLADQIDLKVIGYSAPDPEGRTANKRQ